MKERRVKEEMGEELCAEILETVVDAECSALVVEEVLGAEAAAKMRKEGEARRLKAEEERRVKQEVGDELAAEVLEAVAHTESRALAKIRQRLRLLLSARNKKCLISFVKYLETLLKSTQSQGQFLL